MSETMGGMPDESFPRPDVRADNYLGASCPHCGRLRLELFVDGPKEEPRAVGIACEKCSAQWLLDSASADFHGKHSDSDPLRPRPDDDNDPFSEAGK